MISVHADQKSRGRAIVYSCRDLPTRDPPLCCGTHEPQTKGVVVRGPAGLVCSDRQRAWVARVGRGEERGAWGPISLSTLPLSPPFPPREARSLPPSLRR